MSKGPKTPKRPDWYCNDCAVMVDGGKRCKHCGKDEDENYEPPRYGRVNA